MRQLPYERLKHDKHGYAVYAVRLGDEERSSETLKLNVLCVFTEVLKPLPSTIEQAGPHMVLFEVTSLVPSPYETTKQVRQNYRSLVAIPYPCNDYPLGLCNFRVVDLNLNNSSPFTFFIFEFQVTFMCFHHTTT